MFLTVERIGIIKKILSGEILKAIVPKSGEITYHSKLLSKILCYVLARNLHHGDPSFTLFALKLHTKEYFGY